MITTKGRFPTSEDPNGHGLSRRHLAAALDASLRRLGVEVIDLYQLHGWDPLTPVEETLRFLDRRQRIPAVQLVEVDDLDAEPPQRRVQGGGQVTPGQAVPVRVLAGGEA